MKKNVTLEKKLRFEAEVVRQIADADLRDAVGGQAARGSRSRPIGC